VQIPFLISALDRPAFDRTQLCLSSSYFRLFCSCHTQLITQR